ncbi:hypothetical protein EXIGLDRAFT_157849 [Exidia glandulosa HHB12029]|uniref:Uncharacterized protein n=1 Tax=Exidia glandulosa HHB12029 TaxID=1314781 RepID=A0A165N9G6_EXIGL|nr:hypothetical protein EXIGLDRAFT_157849 [Exidia glandulosa HHB12029]
MLKSSTMRGGKRGSSRQLCSVATGPVLYVQVYRTSTVSSASHTLVESRDRARGRSPNHTRPAPTEAGRTPRYGSGCQLRTKSGFGCSRNDEGDREEHRDPILQQLRLHTESRGHCPVCLQLRSRMGTFCCEQATCSRKRMAMSTIASIQIFTALRRT